MPYDVTIVKSPRLLNKLSKINSRGYTNFEAANILRCRFEKPLITFGEHPVRDTDINIHSKQMYHTSFSCPQHSKNKSAVDSSSSKSVVTKDVSNVTFRFNVKQGEYSNSGISDTTSKGQLGLPKYNDEYFDLLDIPGHFNTRGVYGQKANMEQLVMRRSNSDLHINDLRPRDLIYERQRSNIIFSLRKIRNHQFHPKANNSHSNFHGHQRLNYERMPTLKVDNVRTINGQKFVNRGRRNVVEVSCPSTFPTLHITNISKNTRNKDIPKRSELSEVDLASMRQSVDACIQTDNVSDEEFELI